MGRDDDSCCGPSHAREALTPVAPPPARQAPPPSALLDDVTWIEGGPSFVGTRRPVIVGDGEGPPRPTKLSPYGIGRHTVTATLFADFVAATGYVTEAERYGWSFVFRDFVAPETARTAREVPGAPWWLAIEGADWRHPDGPLSSVDERLDHPVVQVSWNDARAFAAWAGGRLPTEAEWEHAARGGTQREFPWGDEEPSDTDPPLNIWQGEFPRRNLGTDGYLGTAPAHSFAPNPFGLYNMSGNVWEWQADRFRVRSLAAVAKRRDAEALAEGERTLKGGSHLCHRSYCHRYRIAGRMGRAPDSATGHIGFRLAFDPPAQSS
jgi:formylglycine-generating enzyme required for sulfatase activity